MSNADTIARTFAQILREWLTPEELAQVQERNAAQTDPRICHSHDFCDANMAMEEAFTRHGVPTFTPVGDDMVLSDETSALWGAAWDKAKASGFNPDQL